MLRPSQNPTITPLHEISGLGVRKVNLLIRETNSDVRAFYERIGYSVEPRTSMARWIVDEPRP